MSGLTEIEEVVPGGHKLLPKGQVGPVALWEQDDDGRQPEHFSHRPDELLRLLGHVRLQAAQARLEQHRADASNKHGVHLSTGLRHKLKRYAHSNHSHSGVGVRLPEQSRKERRDVSFICFLPCFLAFLRCILLSFLSRFPSLYPDFLPRSLSCCLHFSPPFLPSSPPS